MSKVCEAVAGGCDCFGRFVALCFCFGDIGYRGLVPCQWCCRGGRKSKSGVLHLCCCRDGAVVRLSQVGSDLGVCLALSLHAPNDEIRSRIMPTINRQYPIAKVIAACRDYVNAKSPWGAVIPRRSESQLRRRVLIEYVVRAVRRTRCVCPAYCAYVVAAIRATA